MAEYSADQDHHIMLNDTIMVKKSRCKDWLIREKKRWSLTLTSWRGEDRLLYRLLEPLLDSLKEGKKKVLCKDKKCHSYTALHPPPQIKSWPQSPYGCTMALKRSLSLSLFIDLPFLYP